MKKQRLYLLHGLMGTAENHFAHNLQGLSEFYDLILLDLPGHGQCAAAAANPYFESTLQWFMEEVNKKGRGSCIGLSLGASVVIHAAYRHPDWFDSLIVSGYTPLIPSNMEAAMRQQYEYLMDVRSRDPKLAEHFQKTHGERWFDTLSLLLEDLTFNYPVLTDTMIQSLTIPTLILNGAKEKHERDAATRLADLNEKITAGIIPLAGHTVNAEQPEIFNQIAVNYLHSISR